MTIRDQEDVRETISDTVDARRKVQIMKKIYIKDYVNRFTDVSVVSSRWKWRGRRKCARRCRALWTSWKTSVVLHFFAILFCVLSTLILSTFRHTRSVIVVASCNRIIDDSRFAKYVYYIFD